MPEQAEFGWPSITSSYTVHRDGQGYRYYRGALRKAANRGVIWECDHVHYARGFYSEGAQWCANQEHWRRDRVARSQATASQQEAPDG